MRERTKTLALIGTPIDRMLAKLSAKNQFTLPKAVTEVVGPAEYFDVQVRDGQIILTPVRIQ